MTQRQSRLELIQNSFRYDPDADAFAVQSLDHLLTNGPHKIGLICTSRLVRPDLLPKHLPAGWTRDTLLEVRDKFGAAKEAPLYISPFEADIFAKLGEQIILLDKCGGVKADLNPYYAEEQTLRHLIDTVQAQQAA